MDNNDLTLRSKYFSQWIYITDFTVDMIVIHITISSGQQLINLLEGSTIFRHKPTVSKHNNDISILTLSIMDFTVCSITDRILSKTTFSMSWSKFVCHCQITPLYKSNIYEDINKLNWILSLRNYVCSKGIYITDSRFDMNVIHIAISSQQQLINLLEGCTSCRHETTVSTHNNLDTHYNGHICAA